MNSTNSAKKTAAIVYFDATVRRKEKMRLGASRLTANQVVAPDNAHDLYHSVEDNNRLAAVQSEQEASDTTLRLSVPDAGSNQPDSRTVHRTISLPNGTPTSPTEENGICRDTLSSFLVNFVVEHTGYPPDFVEMDADLEADLGIDSIHVAQMFGEVREQFGITASDDIGLDDFPTLKHVVDYLATN